MRKTLIAAAGALALVAAAAGASAEPGQPHGTVYVTERGAGTAAAFDAATGQVLWKTDVGQLPIGIVHPRGTEKVYTSDEGSNQMTVLERRTGKLIRTIAMGPQPHHLMASRSGKTIYVGEFGHNQIGVDRHGHRPAGRRLRRQPARRRAHPRGVDHARRQGPLRHEHPRRSCPEGRRRQAQRPHGPAASATSRSAPTRARSSSPPTARSATSRCDARTRSRSSISAVPARP